MGKLFYASDKEKVIAGRKANDLARRYKKGVCYTPSREKHCKFDSITELWTCRAAAHHHHGSCGTWEITHGGRGTEWQIGWSWEYEPEGIPAPSNIGTFEEHDPEGEELEDATQEDYEDMDPDKKFEQ
ncbi:MAG: hypothetical protein QM737_18690 [Ferruginibacter sp.]